MHIIKGLKKVSFFDKRLFNWYKTNVGIWLTAISFIWGFLQSCVSATVAVWSLIIIFIIFFGVYIHLWKHFNQLDSTSFEINNSTVEIKFGDFFNDKYMNNKQIVKVFSFNEYFDTKVSEDIIAANTLNGQFLLNVVTKRKISELDKRIANDRNLRDRIVEINSKRPDGKKTKFKLGSIFRYSEDIFLTALSKFDSNNSARLTTQEYLEFLVNFWDQVDKYYGQKTIVIPLFGSGITRIDNTIYNEQDLLKIIIWSFALRRIKFSYPAKLEILLSDHLKEKINLFEIKEIVKNGLS
jgi:hypothetical protein